MLWINYKIYTDKFENYFDTLILIKEFKNNSFKHFF